MSLSFQPLPAAARLTRPSRRLHRARAPPCAALDAASIAGFGPAAVDVLVGTPSRLLGTLAISAASGSAILYFHLQWLTAAHLINNVLPGSRVVLQGDKTGLLLNYLPTTTLTVHMASPELGDAGLLAQAAAQAGKQITSQKLANYGEPLSLEPASQDALVSVAALSTASEPALAVLEAARVLRPGGRLVFFEPGAAPNALTEALAKCGLFSDVRYDGAWAGYPLVARSIGVALRSAQPAPTADGEVARVGRERGAPTRVREPSAASLGKGFGARPEVEAVSAESENAATTEMPAKPIVRKKGRR
jgi:SAM-dependent methyltransferase